jgi:tetratricopeptide (TPR) repeat protein
LEKALAAYQTSDRLSRNAIVPYNIAAVYVRLNRLGEAKEFIRQTTAGGFDAPSGHLLLFIVGFLEKFHAAMEREAQWFKGRPDEYRVIGLQAGVASSSGKLRDARTLYQRASDLARDAGYTEAAAGYLADQAVMESLLETGRSDSLVSKTTAISDERSVTSRLALALSLAGLKAADPLIRQLSDQFPQDTLIRTIWIPASRSAAALHRNDPAGIPELLRPAISYEPGEPSAYSMYVRGLAYLQLKSGNEAAAEFQKIIDHPGVNALLAIHPLARLGLARAYTLTGDKAKARQAYQDLLAAWKDADPDVPILVQAKTEYGKLN